MISSWDRMNQNSLCVCRGFASFPRSEPKWAGKAVPPRCSDDSTSLFGWLVRFCAVCVLFSAAWTVDVWSGIRKRLHGHGADDPHYRWGANRALRLLRLRTFFADFGCHPLFMRNQMAESAKAAEVSQKSNSSKGSRLGSNEKLKRTTMRQQKGRNHKCSNQLDQWPTWWDVQHYYRRVTLENQRRNEREKTREKRRWEWGRKKGGEQKNKKTGIRERKKKRWEDR